MDENFQTKASAPELSENRLYPIITDNNFDTITQIQQSRVRELEGLSQSLKDLLEHYKKIKKRWTKIDSGVKIIGVSLASLTATVAAIIAPFNLVLVASILTGISAGKSVLVQSVSVGFTSKKVKQYREINEEINFCINKLFIFNQKALNYNLVIIDEIKKAYNIVNNLKK